MDKHEVKNCPRCGEGFECKSGDISKCQCYEVKLTDKERDHVYRKYTDCLCAACLKVMKAVCQQEERKAQWKQVAGNR